MLALDFFSTDLLAATLVVALLSLLVGSFLNVVIHRIPLMMQQQWDTDISGVQPTEKLLSSKSNGQC